MSYDYVSKDGSDWLGHVTIGYTTTNYYAEVMMGYTVHSIGYIWATQY